VGKRPYRLKPGQRKVLCKTQFRALWCPGKSSVTNADGYEIVEVFADEFETDREYVDPRLDSSHINFRIRRQVIDHNRSKKTYKHRKAAFVNKTTYLTIPEAAVPQLAKLSERLIRKVYTYLCRHPEQSQLRYEYEEAPQRKRRWQIHFPERNFDELILPSLRYTFAYRPEDLLFYNKDNRKAIYSASIKRLVHPSELENETSWCLYPRLNSKYLKRLEFLTAGKVCWHPKWEGSEYIAQNDLARIKLHYLSRHAFVLYATRLATFCLRKTNRIFTASFLSGFFSKRTPPLRLFEKIPTLHTALFACREALFNLPQDSRAPPF
jgi:hypothetical protein